MKALHWTLAGLISLALALASVTPAAARSSDCAQFWTWSHSLEFPPGFWAAGPHTYDFHILSPNGEDNVHIEFQAALDAPLYAGQVQLRLSGLRWNQPAAISQINPRQDTVLQLSWVGDQIREQAATFRQATTFQARWDGGAWVDIPAGPLTRQCALDNPARFNRSWGPNYR